MANQITSETLQKQRKLKEDTYNDYPYQPNSMFIDGKFNPDNWNGGDAGLIRKFFHDIESSGEWQQYYEVDTDDDFYSLVINYNYYEDQAYATIIVDSDKLETYVFSWYKNRGRTALANYGNEIITEEQYIKLLNIIQLTGYKFE